MVCHYWSRTDFCANRIPPVLAWVWLCTRALFAKHLLSIYKEALLQAEACFTVKMATAETLFKISIIVLCTIILTKCQVEIQQVPEDEAHDIPPGVPKGMTQENVVKFTPPNLNEEESHSTRIPSNMKCDGCTAIAHQVSMHRNYFVGTKGK